MFVSLAAKNMTQKKMNFVRNAEAITRLTAERVHRAERTKRKNKAEIATMILHGKNGRE